MYKMDGNAYAIFGYISPCIEKFCKGNNLTLQRWYHEEARWVIAWEKEGTARYVEILLAGDGNGRHWIRLIPGARKIRKNQDWKLAETSVVRLNPNESGLWPLFDQANPVNLDNFEKELESAYKRANLITLPN